MNIRDITEATTQPPIPTTASGNTTAGQTAQAQPATTAADLSRQTPQPPPKAGDRGAWTDRDTNQQVGGEFQSTSGGFNTFKQSDGSIIKVPVGDMLHPDDVIDKGILEPQGAGLLKRGARATAAASNKGANYANSKKVTVNSDADADELHRIQELAGVETDVPGGSASIIGNTAHKPTDRLRARLRKEKLKKK